jgi:hypothetical protein
MTEESVAMETLVEFAVVVRQLPYSDGRADVEARGLNTSYLYRFQQGHHQGFLRPGDPVAVYRPATSSSMRIVDLKKFREQYRFAVINEAGEELTPPPESA